MVTGDDSSVAVYRLFCPYWIAGHCTEVLLDGLWLEAHLGGAIYALFLFHFRVGNLFIVFAAFPLLLWLVKQQPTFVKL